MFVRQKYSLTHTDIDTDKDTDTVIDTDPDSHTYRKTDRDRHVFTSTGKQTGSQAGRQTDR